MQLLCVVLVLTKIRKLLCNCHNVAFCNCCSQMDSYHVSPLIIKKLRLQVAIPKKQLAQDYLHLPCAILRGALTQLGLDCTVSFDVRPYLLC